MLLRCLLPLALLPLAAVASAACTLTDPTLTLQSYRVDAQKERIAMYWQDRHGKAWGSLRSLLAGIDGDGRVQMAMNGGIYDKAYAPLGLYIEAGWCLCSAIARPTFTILPAMRSQSLACGRCFISTAPFRRCTAKAAACRGSIIRS